MQHPVKVSWNQTPAAGEPGPVQRLSRLSAARRKRLASRTGASYSDAASLVDHLSRPDVARQIFCELSPDALCMARLFVEAVEALPTKAMEVEAARRFGEARAQAALAELEQASLVMRTRWAGGAELVGLVPPLTRSGRAYLWLLGDTREPGEVEVTEPATRASTHVRDLRTLGLALAAVATDPPRILRDGDVHSADLAKVLEERFGAQTAEPELRRAVRRLVNLGVVAGHGGRARVVWWRAGGFFALPPSARLPALLATDPPGTPGGRSHARIPGLASAQHVRRLFAAALLELPIGRWARREALEGAVRMRILASDALTPYTDHARATGAASTHVSASVEAMLPTLERHTTPQGDQWLRLPLADEGDEAAGWLVQPTHEIMVPPEVTPAKLVRLASVADLLRADVMSTFRIDPRSVARAAAAGLSRDEILERLGEGSTTPLPPTLGTQVEGWLRQANPAAYGLPAGEEEEEAPDRELPVHRRPTAAPLPRPPATRWAKRVAAFRKDALHKAN